MRRRVRRLARAGAGVLAKSGSWHGDSHRFGTSPAEPARGAGISRLVRGGTNGTETAGVHETLRSAEGEIRAASRHGGAAGEN